MQEIINYLPLNRKLFEHHFWCEEREYSRFEAWLDLLQCARFEDTETYIGSKVITVLRSCILVSVRYLAKRWQWSTKKVTNFLSQLKNFQMIKTEVHKEAGRTLITILNYNKYNFKKKDKESDLYSIQKQKSNKVNTPNQKENKEEVSKMLHLEKENNNLKSILLTSEKEENSFTLKKFKQTLTEAGANPQHVNDWCKVRKQKGGNFTRTVLESFLAECSKHNYPIAQAVQICAEKNWRGFKVEWVNNLENKRKIDTPYYAENSPNLIRKRAV